MGGSQSNTGNKSSIIESVPVSDPQFAQAGVNNETSGVRVSGKVFQEMESKIQEAYTKGKQDGLSSFQTSLESIAAEVYGNVESQLSNIQQQKLEDAKRMVSACSCCLFFRSMSKTFNNCANYSQP